MCLTNEVWVVKPFASNFLYFFIDKLHSELLKETNKDIQIERW